MSGKESIRGYIIQTMIAILESLQRDWKCISVEPDTKNDKVDILWTENDSSENLYQVKSSINDFGKTEILSYLLDLYKENQNANSFRIILVGNASTKTKDFFKTIQNCEIEEFEERFVELFPIRDKIMVEIYPFHLPTLDAAIITHIERYLSSKKIQVDIVTKELIYGGLMNQYMVFSTSGKKWTKSQFENKLLGWINYNYADYITKSNDELYLSFYLTNFIDFEDEISKIQIPDIHSLSFIADLKNEILTLYEKINEYNIIIKEEPIEEYNNQFSEILKTIDFPSLARTFPEYKNEPVVISNYEKNNLRDLFSKYFGLELNDNFFYFGDLTESKSRHIFVPNQSSTILNGTEEEKNKKNDYDDFDINLDKLNDILSFWSQIQELNILPIVFTNDSNSYENGVRIKLFIPKNVKIYYPKDFPHPNRLDGLKIFNDTNNILTYYLKHQKDSKVDECYSSKFPKFIYEFESTFGIFGMSGYETKKEKRLVQFYDIIEHIYDFEVFHDNSEYTIFECIINELSANETISLPAFIFYKFDREFDIEYEINSKRLSTKIKGVLRIKN